MCKRRRSDPVVSRQRCAHWSYLLLAAWVGACVLLAAYAGAQEPVPAPAPTVMSPTVMSLSECPPAAAAPRPARGPQEVLQGPVISGNSAIERLPSVDAQSGPGRLPINLATALRLSGARPLLISAAQTSAQIAATELQQARILWLPNLYLGPSYYQHNGGAQAQSGDYFNNSRNTLMVGAGPVVEFATTDAIFAPLAARQVLRARDWDVQRAKNDALLDVAEAYFSVQQARGRIAGYQDSVDRVRVLRQTVAGLSADLVPPIEVNRVNTLAASLNQSLAQAEGDWGMASADLTRVLRLDPTSLVIPVEPPQLQITLISPRESLDELIPIGLTNRPELASQQALVQASLARLRQERIRPLLPSVLIMGDAGQNAPGDYLMGGFFQSNVNGMGSVNSARNDVSVQLLWALNNLGAGNRALVRMRSAEQQQYIIELFRTQDMVAAEIARSHANLVAAAARVREAETGIQQGLISYQGNLKGISQTTRFGDVLVLVNRPQEAVAALQQLASAYETYFIAVNEFNRAQFRLYRALGYPAGILAYERSPGPILDIDTRRPAMMPPVGGPVGRDCPPK